MNSEHVLRNWTVLKSLNVNSLEIASAKSSYRNEIDMLASVYISTSVLFVSFCFKFPEKYYRMDLEKLVHNQRERDEKKSNDLTNSPT